jgi:hypothetical protein
LTICGAKLAQADTVRVRAPAAGPARGTPLSAGAVQVRAPEAANGKFDVKMIPGFILNGGDKGTPGQGNGQGNQGQGQGNGQGNQGQGNFGQGNKGPGEGPGNLGQGNKGPWPGGPGHDPKHHPWPKPWKHPHHPPVVYQPIIEESSPTYYEADATNPVPAASIQLVNPTENQWTLNFRLDGGEVQSLSAGYSMPINRVTIITFDRGGGAGQARYQLTDGAYKFVVFNGQWDLVHQAATSPQEAAAYPGEETNPVPTN